MSSLNSEHTDFIIKDLHHRGIVLDDLQDEIIDHVCAAVEEKMQDGQRFADAYREVISAFGDTSGLNKTQELVIQSKRLKFLNMIKSYFIIGLRNNLKNKFYSLINIGGLAIGVASCLIISLFVINELSYDRSFPNANRIYRINTEIKFGTNHFILASTSAGVAPLMHKDYEEIEGWTRLDRRGPQFIQSPDGKDAFKETAIFWADSSFFKIFQIPILEGNPGNALTELNSIAISKSIANKYFPGENALGRSLSFQGSNNELKVTAVFEDVPRNAHFHPGILVSMPGNREAASESLVGGGDFTTYLLLREDADPLSLQSKFRSFVDKYVAPQVGAVVGGDFTMQQFRASGQLWEYTLTSLTDIHLRSDRTGDLEPNGSMAYVKLLSSIGLLILAIACVNFINLSTARSSKRAKEVGIRKVMGSIRSHLVNQFLVESLILTFASFILSLGLAWMFIPTFNDLSLQSLSIPFTNPVFYAIFIGAAVAIGIAAGVYPSFFLSGFKPVKVLKGNVSLGVQSGFIRSTLVVSQFVISIFLIIGTIAIQRQLSFIQEKNLGFNKDQVLVVRDVYQLGGKLKEYKNEILSTSFISNATISGFLPVSGTWRGRDTYWPEGSAHNIDELVSLSSWQVDDDYIKTLGMTVVTGREFNSLQTSDSSSILVNEAAVRALGFGKEPLGKKLIQIVGNNPDGTPDPNKTKEWTVIGVVQDFHFESMKDAIEPVAFFMMPSNGYMALRFEAQHAEEAINTAEQLWNKMAPASQFAYSFLDEDFAKMYSYENRLGRIFATFSVLAIIIACLGLFALTAFTAEQRTKEIGIRKVLGASIPSIVVLLSKELGKLVLIAFVIAVPIAWYSVTSWLTDYSYKTEIGVWIYIFAGVIIATIAIVTMSFQSIRSALANPVKSLRSE